MLWEGEIAAACCPSVEWSRTSMYREARCCSIGLDVQFQKRSVVVFSCDVVMRLLYVCTHCTCWPTACALMHAEVKVALVSGRALKEGRKEGTLQCCVTAVGSF